MSDDPVAGRRGEDRDGDGPIEADREAAAVDPARGLLDRLRRGAPQTRRGRANRGGQRRRALLHPDEQVWSGPHPGERDPMRLSATLDGLVAEEGWRRTLDEASLAPRWASIVGPAVAEHCRPDSLSGGVLTVRAESTAWATQLRLMGRTLLTRIAAEVGEGVVTKLRVLGPTGPDWRHGPLRVRGRGPRDTYG